MIDVSQWRASIGLWNYCQAASSSRPANGRHSLSLKAAVDSKSGSTKSISTSRKRKTRLPAAFLSCIAFLLVLFFSLLRHTKFNSIILTSKCKPIYTLFLCV